MALGAPRVRLLLFPLFPPLSLPRSRSSGSGCRVSASVFFDERPPARARARISRNRYVTELGRVECKDELEAYVKEHGMPVDDGIDPKDRTTWVCHKDGKWLSEHPE